MRCHVHGKLEYAGVLVAFTISLDAVTRQAAELYVQDLFLGVYTVPAIEARVRDTDAPPDVEIIDIDSFEGSDLSESQRWNCRVLDDLARATHSQTDTYLKKGRHHTRNTLAVHRRRTAKPFRMKYLRDAW